MKSAVVTGANGFIGSNLCRELQNRGVRVYAIVREESDTEILDFMNVQNIFRCDADAYDDMGKIIPFRNMDAFYHIAWRGSTGDKRSDYMVQIENIRMAMCAVMACAALGCKRFIGAGTLAEKDVIRYVGQDGATPDSVSCYGSAKLAAHYMTKAACNSRKIDHIWTNIGNVYGKGDTSSNFVNHMINIFLGDGNPDFTKGEQLYDFVHIKDVIRGLCCVGLSGINNHCYYIGSGEPKPLKEYVITVRDLMDPSLPIHFGTVNYNGRCADKSEYDIAKIRETGYQPQISFQEGVRERIDEARMQRRME